MLSLCCVSCTVTVSSARKTQAEGCCVTDNEWDKWIKSWMLPGVPRYSNWNNLQSFTLPRLVPLDSQGPGKSVKCKLQWIMNVGWRRMMTRENDHNKNINRVWRHVTSHHFPALNTRWPGWGAQLNLYFLCLELKLYVIWYPWDPLSPAHCFLFVSHSNSRQRTSSSTWSRSCPELRWDSDQYLML